VLQKIYFQAYDVFFLTFAWKEIIMPRRPRLLHLLLALSAAPLAAQATPTYTIAPVPALGNSGSAFGLNNAGQVAGTAYNGGRSLAYVSQNGTATSLHPADPRFSSSEGRGINESGAVVGQLSYQNGPTRAAVFTNGGVQMLGTLGGASSFGNAINASGQVAGQSDTSSGSRHGFVTDANGNLVDIGPLNGGGSSSADAINDFGAVTGYAEINALGDYRAYIYANGTMQTLGTLGGNYSQGYAINNAGMVAGYSYLADNLVPHAFLYANGLMVDIGSFSEGAYAAGINEAGDVVGIGIGADSMYHAFLYSGGKFQDLNDLIDSSLGWTVNFAWDINDKGQIAARGCKGDKCADLLLTLADNGSGGGGNPSPVSEPEAVTAGLAGLILSGLLRRRRQR
jgi:probable HAF family extracellular repeat protein